MSPRAIFLLIACSLMTGAASQPYVMLRDGSGALRPPPAPAVLLFWAAWCAPCRAEIRDLENIRRMAAPLPVIIVAAEGDARSRALLRALPDEAVRYPADAATDVMSLIPGGGAALPAAMAHNVEGVICGIRRGVVTSADLVEWRDRCAGQP